MAQGRLEIQSIWIQGGRIRGNTCTGSIGNNNHGNGNTGNGNNGNGNTGILNNGNGHLGYCRTVDVPLTDPLHNSHFTGQEMI